MAANNLNQLSSFLEGATIKAVWQPVDGLPLCIQLTDGRCLWFEDSSKMGADGGVYASLAIKLTNERNIGLLLENIWLS
jgi:hypothetical protein